MQPAFQDSFIEMMRSAELPSVAHLNRMNLYRLQQMAEDFVEKIEDSGSKEISMLEDLSKFPKLQNIFKIRNKRVFKAALKSPNWQKLIKANSNFKAGHSYIDSKEKFVSFELPKAIAEGAIRKVFEVYMKDLMGFWSLVRISPAGKIKDLFIVDSEDLDLFYMFFLKLSIKKESEGLQNFQQQFLKQALS